MKKNISISLEDTLAQDMKEMSGPEYEDRASISNTITHLLKTHPKYLEFKVRREMKKKSTKRK